MNDVFIHRNADRRIIGFTVGGLAIAFKSAEKELARLDKEVKDAHKQNKSKG